MVTIQVNTPVRSIAMLQRRLHPWQVGWRTYAACREKDLSWAQPVQLVALTSPVACCQSAISKWRP